MVKIDVEYILPQNADGLNHTCTKLQMQGRMKTSLTQSYYKKSDVTSIYTTGIRNMQTLVGKY